MDKTLDQTIVDETVKQLSLNNEEIPINSSDDFIPTSSTVPCPDADTGCSPKEINADEICTPSNSFVQQEHRPMIDGTYEYRIHIATQPGYVKEDQILFPFSEKRHSQMIDVLNDFLGVLKINYKIIRKDCFSNSKWGLEPYACILLSCSDEMVKTVAAIIGLALRQDAIGIYYTNGEGFPHPVFTISTANDSLFTKNDALVLMRKIPKHYPSLAAQFDENGKNIELHDFGDGTDSEISVEDIETTINRYFGTNNLFRITKTTGCSDLLENKDYYSAIEQTGHKSIGKLIELTRLHDELYGKSEST